MAKLPSFQFYPGDWLKDLALRAVSPAARGLWIDLLCLMFDSPRRGYLQQANGQPLALVQVARMTGCSTDEVAHLLQELEDAGVFSRTEHGTIHSRRLVRDERSRQQVKNRVQKFRSHVTPDVTHGVTQPVTALKHRSSSSSSSSNQPPAPSSVIKPVIPQPIDGTSDAVVGEILIECRISGKDLRNVLDDVVRAEMRAGVDPWELKDHMCAVYREWVALQPQLDFLPSVEKFFGGGYWNNRAKWKRKDGAPITAEKRVSGIERMKQQAAN